MILALNGISTDLAGLSTLRAIPNSGTGGQYRLTATLSYTGFTTDLSDAQTNIGNAPDGAAIFASLSTSASLLTYSQEIGTVSSKLETNIKKNLVDGAASLFS